MDATSGIAASAIGRGASGPGRQRSHVRFVAVRATAIVLAVVCAAAVPGRASALEVRLEGLEGAQDGLLEDNVRSVLAILELADEGDPAEAQVRRRHDQAEDQIRHALEPFGYYRPTIRSLLEFRDEEWLASYRVDPGDPIRLDTLRIAVVGEGRDDAAFREVVRGFPLREGDVLNHLAYEEGKEAFALQALERGYLAARFTGNRVRVDLDRYAASIRLEFDTGPRYRYGEVRFHQDVVDPDLLRGYVRFERGEHVDFDELLLLQNSLSESPYFQRVEVDPRREEAEDAHLPIDVNLVPSRPLVLEIGGGFGTDTGPRGRASALLPRLNRQGHRLEAETQVSVIERSASARYQIPWAYPRTDRLHFSVGYRNESTETSDSETGLVGTSFTRLRGRWRETFSLQFEREDYTVGADTGTVNLLEAEASWTRVIADDRLDPFRGYRLRVSFRGAHDALFSQESFVQAETRAKGVLGFARRHRLIGRGSLGYMETDAFRRLPPSARFFAGGSQSVRGYAFEGLGSRDEKGNVIGGTGLVVGSLEYEFRFLRTWGVALFADAGTALRDLDDPLSVGVGPGLRWLSPVGLVRVDLGWALTPDDTPLHLHLTIGPDL